MEHFVDVAILLVFGTFILVAVLVMVAVWLKQREQQNIDADVQYQQDCVVIGEQVKIVAWMRQYGYRVEGAYLRRGGIKIPLAGLRHYTLAQFQKVARERGWVS